MHFARSLGGIATAAMDLSDGLFQDLRRLCEASDVGATVEVKDLPIATGCTLAHAVHGGEDYQLLFTAPTSHRAQVHTLAKDRHTAVRRIGSTTIAPRMLLNPDGWGRPLFEHFQ